MVDERATRGESVAVVRSFSAVIICSSIFFFFFFLVYTVVYRQEVGRSIFFRGGFAYGICTGAGSLLYREGHRHDILGGCRRGFRVALLTMTFMMFCCVCKCVCVLITFAAEAGCTGHHRTKAPLLIS